MLCGNILGLVHITKSLFSLILKTVLLNHLKFQLNFAVILSAVLKNTYDCWWSHIGKEIIHISFPGYKLPCKETRKMYFTVHYVVNKRRLKSSSAQTRSVQQMDFYWLFWINAIIFKKAYYKQVQYHKISLNMWRCCFQPAQLLQRWSPFSLQAVHLRALKESVKQFRNTDILLPWHAEHGRKPKPPQERHSWGCWTLCSKNERKTKCYLINHHKV